MRTVSLSKCIQKQSSSIVLIGISIAADIEDIKQLEKVMDYTKEKVYL